MSKIVRTKLKSISDDELRALARKHGLPGDDEFIRRVKQKIAERGVLTEVSAAHVARAKASIAVNTCDTPDRLEAAAEALAEVLLQEEE